VKRVKMASISPKNIKLACWTAVTVFFVISLFFSVLTVDNYQDIARAKALTFFTTETKTLLSYDGNGALESLGLHLNMTVHNPSGKELRLWLVGYKVWLRDWPMEDGMETGRRTVDGDLVVDNATRFYYPVFSTSFSFGTEDLIAPSHTDLVVTRTLQLNESVDENIMQNAREILAHANATGRNAEWYEHAMVRIFIQVNGDVTEGQSTDFLIMRTLGRDLTPGSAGVAG
jgi:hypothetical protein